MEWVVSLAESKVQAYACCKQRTLSCKLTISNHVNTLYMLHTVVKGQNCKERSEEGWKKEEHC